MQDENMEQQGPRREKQGEIWVKFIHHKNSGGQKPMHFSFWKSNVWLKAILQSDCDIKVFLEEWLTDYRAKLMRKCKLLLKVQYVCVVAFFAFTFKNLPCTDSAESVQSACNRF